MPKIWEIQVHLLSQSIDGFYQMLTQIALCHPVKYPGINGFNGCKKIFISKTTHAWTFGSVVKFQQKILQSSF